MQEGYLGEVEVKLGRILQESQHLLTRRLIHFQTLLNFHYELLDLRHVLGYLSNTPNRLCYATKNVDGCDHRPTSWHRPDAIVCL